MPSLSDPIVDFGLPALHDPMGEVAGVEIDGDPLTEEKIRVVQHFATPLKRENAPHSETVSTLLYGEPVALHDAETSEGLVACISLIDGYRGYVDAAALAPYRTKPSHRVIARSAHIYSAADIKSAPLVRLPYGALVSGEAAGKFIALTRGGFVFSQHATTLSEVMVDPVAEAEKFIGAPYLWGGRSADGIDCSGLVQISLSACGQRVLRDSGSQFKSIGAEVPEGELPQRGDLAFFPGHVGWMIDADHILHANATNMAVTIDPLKEVVSWVAKETTKPPFSGFRRLRSAG